MQGVNKALIIGQLGKDPELRYTPAGKAVVTFSVATTEKWKDGGGQQQQKTEWHNIVVWGKLGELCNQYLKKGKAAYIEGKMATRSWEDNGVKRYKTEVVASVVQFLSPQDRQDGGSRGPVQEERWLEDNIPEDDLPF